MVSNKRAGTQFERQFAFLLSAHGFWAHLFQDNRNGQPCDVIACRNGNTYLFDCKDCQGDYFVLSRMEENQYNAMHLFELTGNGQGRFAIRFTNGAIYLVKYCQIKTLIDQGIRRISQEECRLYGEDFFMWLHIRDQIDGWCKNIENQDWK